MDSESLLWMDFIMLSYLFTVYTKTKTLRGRDRTETGAVGHKERDGDSETFSTALLERSFQRGGGIKKAIPII